MERLKTSAIPALSMLLVTAIPAAVTGCRDDVRNEIALTELSLAGRGEVPGRISVSAAFPQDELDRCSDAEGVFTLPELTGPDFTTNTFNEEPSFGGSDGCGYLGEGAAQEARGEFRLSVEDLYEMNLEPPAYSTREQAWRDAIGDVWFTMTTEGETFEASGRLVCDPADMGGNCEIID